MDAPQSHLSVGANSSRNILVSGAEPTVPMVAASAKKVGFQAIHHDLLSV